MSGTYERRLVTGTHGLLSGIAGAVIVLGFVGVVLGWSMLFLWVDAARPLFGVHPFTILGVDLLVMGIAILGCGAASRAGFVATTPDDTAGIGASVAFGVVGVVVGALVGSQTLGLGTVGWVALAVVLGLVAVVATLVPREDVGSVVVPGALALAGGAAVLTGAFGPEWTWRPDGFSAGLTPTVAVPVLFIACAVLAGWAGAKAYGGFGARGRQAGAFLLMGLNVAVMMTVLALLILFIIMNGFSDAFEEFSIGLDGIHWPFVQNGFVLLGDEPSGIFPAIVGTVWLVIGTVVLAVPLAVGAAVYLTEYAPEGRFTRAVDIATNALWSTPSIVFGLFGLAFLVPRLGNHASLLAGILVLSFMLLPLVLITSREALEAVPDEYRDASAALGVSQWQTIKSVVVPAAMPGVITGTILGVGRIAGETAPILLVMSGGLTDHPPNVLGSFEFTTTPPFVANEALLQTAPALPYQLFAGITAGVSSDISNWGTALVLLLVVLSFYAVGIALRAYFRRSLTT